MSTFDEFQQARVMWDASMQLYEDGGEIRLGPLPDGKKPNPIIPGSAIKVIRGTIADRGIQRYMILAGVVESLLFTAILLYFVIRPGDVEKQMFLMIALMVGVSAIFAPVFVGLVLYDKALVKRKTRFRRLPSGDVIVRDDQGEEVTISPNGDKRIAIKSVMDRDGNELYDIFLHVDGETYYLVSGSDLDDMERIKSALQETLSESR